MGRIAIVTDGSLIPGVDHVADAVVPFSVQYQNNKKEQISLSGQEIDQERFLLIQQSCASPPRTAAPNVSDFKKYFEKLWLDGFTDILVLTIPESYSSTYNNAIIAGRETEANHQEVRVRVVDTGTTVAGVKYLAELASNIRAQGEEFESVVRSIERARKKIEIFVAFDTIKYVSASGRISELHKHRLAQTAKKYARGLVAKLVTLAHHSPKLVLSIKDGQEKILSFSLDFANAINRLTDLVEESSLTHELKRIYVYQSQAEMEAKKIGLRLNWQRDLGEVVEVVVEPHIPLALLATTGPKLVAAVCIYE